MFPALALFVVLLFVSAGFVAIAWGAARRFSAGAGTPDPHALARFVGDSRTRFSRAALDVHEPRRLRRAAGVHAASAGRAKQGHRVVPSVPPRDGAGVFVVSSYWCAVTLGWIVTRHSLGLTGEVGSDFKGLCLASIVGMAVPAAIILLLGGWLALGLALLALVGPIAGYAPSILRRKQTPPLYARAVARMKFGKYSEAEWAIIQELEKCEDDFDGWLMLADLYANHFKDLSEAEQTILEICDQPRTTASQIAVALHKLADWQVNLDGDPEAARRALEVIFHRLPGTHLARMAQCAPEPVAPHRGGISRATPEATPSPCPRSATLSMKPPHDRARRRSAVRAAELAGEIR